MKKYKLGDICEIVSGSTPKTNIAEFWDGDVKWITPAELDENTYIITDSVRKITNLAMQKTGLTAFPAGTVILSSRAPIGKVAIAGCKMCCNQGFKNFICSEIVNNKYLYWFLKHNTAYLNSLGRGATFKEISKSIVSSIEINLPSLEEQQRVVDNIEKISTIITLRKKEISILDDLIKARFVEMFGDEKWGFKPLSECVDSIDTGKSMNCGEGPRGVGGFGVLKLSALSSGTFVASENKVISKDNFMSIKEVEKGDLLFARKNTPELVGTTVYVPNEVRGLMFPDLVFRMKPKDVNALYLLAYMRSDRGLDLIQGMAHGSAKSMVNIPKTQLARLPVPVPPLELQQEFADFVAQVDKSKFKLGTCGGML